MASGAGKWERVPLVPQTRDRQAAAATPTSHRGAEAAPLFSRLAREWRAQGRVVPGARDQEWEVLVRRPVWPGR